MVAPSQAIPFGLNTKSRCFRRLRVALNLYDLAVLELNFQIIALICAINQSGSVIRGLNENAVTLADINEMNLEGEARTVLPLR
ncbi:MAG: hypothetical protein ABI690_19585 [Chloroflexota bacterium]